jgi:hypothetical protein
MTLQSAEATADATAATSFDYTCISGHFLGAEIKRATPVRCTASIRTPRRKLKDKPITGLSIFVIANFLVVSPAFPKLLAASK